MAHRQTPIAPTGLCESGFLALLGRIGEEDLRRHREDPRVAEAFEERREKVRLHAHIVVEQDDDIMTRRAKAGVRPAPKADVGFKRQNAHFRELPLEHFTRAVGRAIIDDQNFVPRVVPESRNQGRQIAFQMLAAVPGRDHHADRRAVDSFPVIRWVVFPSATRHRNEQIVDRER